MKLTLNKIKSKKSKNMAFSISCKFGSYFMSMIMFIEAGKI